MSIDDAEVFELATSLAKLTGETPEAAIKTALREQLDRALTRGEKLKKIKELQDRIAADRIVGVRPEDAIEYGEFGEPV